MFPSCAPRRFRGKHPAHIPVVYPVSSARESAGTFDWKIEKCPAQEFLLPIALLVRCIGNLKDAVGAALFPIRCEVGEEFHELSPLLGRILSGAELISLRTSICESRCPVSRGGTQRWAGRRSRSFGPRQPLDPGFSTGGPQYRRFHGSPFAWFAPDAGSRSKMRVLPKHEISDSSAHARGAGIRLLTPMPKSASCCPQRAVLQKCASPFVDEGFRSDAGVFQKAHRSVREQRTPPQRCKEPSLTREDQAHPRPRQQIPHFLIGCVLDDFQAIGHAV